MRTLGVPALPALDGPPVSTLEDDRAAAEIEAGAQQLAVGAITHARLTVQRAIEEARDDAAAVDRLLNVVYRLHADGRTADDVLDSFHDAVAPWLSPAGVRRVDLLFDSVDVARAPEALGVLLLTITRLTRHHFPRRDGFLERFAASLTGRGNRTAAQVEALLRGLRA